MPSGKPETSPRSPLLLKSSLTLPPPCFLPFSGSQFRTKMMRRDAFEIPSWIFVKRLHSAEERVINELEVFSR